MIPGPWEFVLLTLAVFRLWRLVAEDSVLDRPRAWLLGVPGWLPVGGETPPAGYREKLALWLTCPWCAGFWLSVAAWAGWVAEPRWTLILAVPWALSGAVGLVASKLG